MDTNIAHTEKHSVPALPPTDRHWLVEHARRSPWFMTSAFAHVLIIMLAVLLMPVEPVSGGISAVLTAAILPPQKARLDQPEPDDRMSDREIKDDVKVEEPLITDREDEDSRTDNDVESETRKGDPDKLSDSDLTGEGKEGGIGGGGGGGFGDGHGGRFDHGRSSGAPVATIDAVTDALRWLKQHQSPDGSWDVDGFDAYCDPMYGAACDGHGSVTEGDPALTGLALLAYLGAGYTHDDNSEYSAAIRNGLKYLKDLQRDDGIFARETTSHFFMYGHAIATLAMVEAYGLTGVDIFKAPAERGIDAILRAQNDHPSMPGEKFGWRYFPNDGDNDTSVTGWMTMALKSARMCGFAVPDSAFDGIRHWTDAATDDVYYRAGYQTPGGGAAVPEEAKDSFRATESTTAIAVLCRVFCGEKIASSKIRGGAALLSQDLPTWSDADGAVDYYYWYYGSLAMYQLGGDYWMTWSSCMESALLDHQHKRKDGCRWGSWDPQPDKWGMRGGRVYATAINCLTLEVYYRYERVVK